MTDMPKNMLSRLQDRVSMSVCDHQDNTSCVGAAENDTSRINNLLP